MLRMGLTTRDPPPGCYNVPPLTIIVIASPQPSPTLLIPPFAVSYEKPIGDDVRTRSEKGAQRN